MSQIQGMNDELRQGHVLLCDTYTNSKIRARNIKLLEKLTCLKIRYYLPRSNIVLTHYKINRLPKTFTFEV